MPDQNWVKNEESVVASGPKGLPWAPAIDKQGNEVEPPKRVSKPDAKGNAKEYDRPDIVDSNQPTGGITFAQCKAQDNLVRGRIRTEKLAREAAIKKHMEAFVDSTAK